MKTLALAALAALILSGCTASYAPPVRTEIDPSMNSRIVNRSFDETWQTLIEYAASTFFGLDNYEKDSGLLTLSFGSSNPSQFVDGGNWKSTSPKFEGNYVDYMARHLGGRLDGKMNIVVVPIDDENTKVTVNARYVFTATGGNSWVFDSGGSATVVPSNQAMGTTSERTLMPTHHAEQTILSALDQ
jgi:hypothetical protein